MANNFVDLAPGASILVEADQPTEVHCRNKAVPVPKTRPATMFEGVKLYAGANCKALKEIGATSASGTYDISSAKPIVCDTLDPKEPKANYYLVFTVYSKGTLIPRALVNEKDLIFE